jgi:hypothetical protein
MQTTKISFLIILFITGSINAAEVHELNSPLGLNIQGITSNSPLSTIRNTPNNSLKCKEKVVVILVGGLIMVLIPITQGFIEGFTEKTLEVAKVTSLAVPGTLALGSCILRC